MVSQLNKALDDVINCIIESDDYKKCEEIKKQMSNNTELMELIEKIKRLQKKYVNTNDEDMLIELKELEEKLNSIPIYVIYMQYLDRVNEKIEFVKDELNDYFYKVLNN